ncbi:MAG TPA: ATP-binding cassette domain-containing protein [Symbiobacteriaceae bacterium]|nr:ATP-binding cassette domain-containing protein [Symbiobacteriaceae bacterium]
MPAIEAKGLTKEFRVTRSRPGLGGALRDLFDRQHATLRAVDRINLTVESGEIVGYIGANGAGKSTTIKMLTGILQPTSGTLRVGGFDPHRERERFVRTIGVVFGQRSQLWWDIAVQESFRLLQRIYRVSDQQFREYFLGGVADVLEIGPLMATPVRKLSLGQRMRCEMAAALLHRPSLLFLDEPTIGLDVSVKLRIREFLKELNRRYGTTILLTTHDLSDIEALCRRVVMLDRGRIVYDGLLTDLRQRWAGDRTVRVVFGVDVDPGSLSRAFEREDEATFRFRLGEGEDLSDLLPALLKLGPVRDITVLEAGMEEIVRRMYETGGVMA